jgi:uncharacterized membrane protein
MAVKTIFTLVLFLVFIGIFMVGFGIQAATYQQGQYTNTTSANMTAINTGLSNIQVCDYHGDIPILSGLIWGYDCISDSLSVFFGLTTANSDNIFLAGIFLAIVLTIILIIVMVLRGNGII